jgi:hypothetical protein
MPALVVLGNALTNKIATDLYQRHRDNEKWFWKTEGDPAEYEFSNLRKGTNPKKVALILSLSGTIDVDQLPQEIDVQFSLYQIALRGIPNPLFLRQRKDLLAFQREYQTALGAIAQTHGYLVVPEKRLSL